MLFQPTQKAHNNSFVRIQGVDMNSMWLTAGLTLTSINKFHSHDKKINQVFQYQKTNRGTNH